MHKIGLLREWKIQGKIWVLSNLGAEQTSQGNISQCIFKILLSVKFPEKFLCALDDGECKSSQLVKVQRLRICAVFGHKGII